MKKILFSFIFIFLAGCLTGCSESDRSYEKGLALYTEGAYQEALSCFIQAVSQGEAGAGIHFDMALTALESGDESGALAYFDEALSVCDGVPEGKAALKAVRFYLKQGENGKALSLLLSVCEEENVSESAGEEAQGLLGILYLSAGEYEKGIEAFNGLIQKGYYPMEHEILAGECYLKLSQVRAACQYFELAAERKESKPENLLKIYRLLYEAGAYSEAETYLEKGRSLCGKRGGMSETEYLLRSGTITLSGEEDLLKEDTETLLLAAELLTEREEYETAENLYEALVLRGESSERVALDYMKLKILTGAYDNALQLYTGVLLSDDPEILAEGAWNEVILYEKKGEFRTAYEKLTEYGKNYGYSEEALREKNFLKRILGE